MAAQAAIAGRGTLLRFDFGGYPVRGAAFRCDSGWDQWLARRGDAANVARQLGLATAALPLMAAHLKFTGRMNLQFQHGAGLQMLLAQITRAADGGLRLRSTAQTQPDLSAEATWPDMAHGGQLAIMLDADAAKDQYQAVVPAGGESLAADLEGYFVQSEQLRTRVWLAADASACAGLMLQQLPDAAGVPLETGFETVETLAQTVTDAELLGLPADQLVHRLFATEGVRGYDSRVVDLACNCGRDRVASLLLSLGRDEVNAALDEQGTVDVRCEFCGNQEQFDRLACESLFSADAAQTSDEIRH